jgi:hypothetical protein
MNERRESRGKGRGAAGRKWVAFVVAAIGVAGCYAEASGPSVECRNVEVRNRHDVEGCNARCNDDGCHEHCREREHWAHEHRCWVE